MKVEKRIHATEPAYPNRRQFSQYRLLAGVAAIGLGAAVGSGQEGRLGGDIAVSPRSPKIAAQAEETRIRGRIRAEPGPSCTATNAPAASTNQVAPAAASTNQPAAVLKSRGEMPAEPR